MCVAFKQKGKEFRQGSRVEVHGPDGIMERAWVSYARSEKASYWEHQRKAVSVMIAAEAFAERDRRTHQLIWAGIPDGLRILAYLADPRDPGDFLIEPEQDCYIVTRAASPEEQHHFGHDRLPVLKKTASDE